MSVFDPIPLAIPIAKAAICGALSPLVGVDVQGMAACYWLKAPLEAPFPCFVFQSQDNGGQRRDFLDAGGWEGLMTIKALDRTPKGADTLLATVPPALSSLSAAGYTITALLERPLTMPPLDNVWTSGLIYRMTIVRM